jgi:hypothetical protein
MFRKTMHKWPGKVGHLAGAIPDQIATPNTQRNNSRSKKPHLNRLLGCSARSDLSHTIFTEVTLNMKNINDSVAQVLLDLVEDVRNQITEVSGLRLVRCLTV